MSRRLFISMGIAITVITLVAIAVFVRAPGPAVGGRAGQDRAGEDRGAPKSCRNSRDPHRSASRHCVRHEPPVASDDGRGSSQHPRPAGPASS
jgi:hypothetical protein